MKRDHLEAFGYFQFSPENGSEVHRHVSRGVEISLAALPIETLRRERGEFYCACSHPVVDGNDSVVLDVGDSAEGCYLAAFEGLRTAPEALFLRIRQDEAGP
jgi:hypothetical protein